VPENEWAYWLLCAEDLRKALELTKYPANADDVFKGWMHQMSQPKVMGLYGLPVPSLRRLERNNEAQ
jgi:hypothetical protein